MVSSTSARSDSTRPWFTIGLTRQPTSISPHCAYMQMHCVYVCMKIRTSLRELRRGDGISRWSPRLFPRVLPVWGSLLPILTHMGLGRRAHLGIRHMVNMVGFVIWLESHKENTTQGLTWAKIRSALICHTGVRPYTCRRDIYWGLFLFATWWTSLVNRAILSSSYFSVIGL